MNGTRLETAVYRKPTNTGLLLHFHSHTDKRYKDCLIKTMVHRAHALSSTTEAFNQECDRLRSIFTRLDYPMHVINSTINNFVQNVSLDTPKESETHRVIRVSIPFKDQTSANAVRRQLCDLSHKINVSVQPVFVSKKLEQDLKPKELKPAILNHHCVVYSFSCDLCDSDYVGYTARHLHKRIAEHKSSAIGKHFKEAHGDVNLLKANHFRVLKKCRGKFDCLIYEMLFIKKLRPNLNTQADSIRAKLFV